MKTVDVSRPNHALKMRLPEERGVGDVLADKLADDVGLRRTCEAAPRDECRQLSLLVEEEAFLRFEGAGHILPRYR